MENGNETLKIRQILKKNLQNTCELFTEGPICVGGGSKIISKRSNLNNCVGDFRFGQEIVTKIIFKYLGS